MPVLTVDISHDVPDSGLSTDPEQIVTVQRVIDGAPDPYPESFTLSAGIGTITLDAGYWWVHRFGGSKLVQLTADARLDELAALDPTTLEAEAPQTPAWEAALALRPVLVRLTQAEYDALTPAEQTDPLKLYVIPAI